jgi:hypothetical protein
VHRTRTAVALTAAAASIVLIGVVSGCASASAQGATLASAKQQTIQLENKIASFVPHDFVKSTSVTQTSKVIFPCLGHDGESYWPGSLTLGLKTGVDNDDVLTAIAANWTNKSGWSVFKTTGADGNASLSIKSDKGQSFTVQFVDGPVFTISALSSCFSSSGLTGKSSY